MVSRAGPLALEEATIADMHAAYRGRDMHRARGHCGLPGAHSGL